MLWGLYSALPVLIQLQSNLDSWKMKHWQAKNSTIHANNSLFTQCCLAIMGHLAAVLAGAWMNHADSCRTEGQILTIQHCSGKFNQDKPFCAEVYCNSVPKMPGLSGTAAHECGGGGSPAAPPTVPA